MIDEKETEKTKREKLVQEVSNYVDKLTEDFCHEHCITSTNVVSAAVLDCVSEWYMPDRENEKYVVKKLVKNWLNRKLTAKNLEIIS